MKARWKLTVTEAEKTSLTKTLSACEPVQFAIAPLAVAAPIIVQSTTTAPTTTTIVVVEAAPGNVVLVACDKRAERVTIANRGGESISLGGYRLHDRGDKHATSLGGFGSLDSGQALAILTGPDAVAGEDQVVWKRQNVWNNDGDTAFLVAPDRSETSVDC